jgi:hypothetical protein
MAGGSVLNEQVTKAEDDGIDQIRQLTKRWENRLTLHNLRITERYLKGESRIIVVLRAPNLLTDTEKFCAIIERPSILRGLQQDALLEFRGQESRRETFGNVDHDSSMGGSDNKEQTMFVGIVKFIEAPEFLSPAAVWVERADSVFSFLGHSLYFSFKYGFVLCGSLGNGKPSNTVSGLVPVGQDKVPSKMIEGSSEILQDVPNNSREVIGERRAFAKLKNQISSFRLVLSENWIWCGAPSEEEMDTPIELSDVMFGPFDFQANGLDASHT